MSEDVADIVNRISQARSLVADLTAMIKRLDDERERLIAGVPVAAIEALDSLRSIAISRIKGGRRVIYYHPEHGLVRAEPYDGRWRMYASRCETKVSAEYLIDDIAEATMVAAEVS